MVWETEYLARETLPKLNVSGYLKFQYCFLKQVSAYTISPFMFVQNNLNYSKPFTNTHIFFCLLCDAFHVEIHFAFVSKLMLPLQRHDWNSLKECIGTAYYYENNCKYLELYKHFKSIWLHEVNACLLYQKCSSFLFIPFTSFRQISAVNKTYLLLSNICIHLYNNIWHIPIV